MSLNNSSQELRLYITTTRAFIRVSIPKFFVLLLIDSSSVHPFVCLSFILKTIVDNSRTMLASSDHENAVSVVCRFYIHYDQSKRHLFLDINLKCVIVLGTEVSVMVSVLIEHSVIWSPGRSLLVEFLVKTLVYTSGQL